MTDKQLLDFILSHTNARFKSGNYNYTKIAREISEKGLDTRSVNTLRFLLADLVERTDSEQEDVPVIEDPLEIEWATNKYVYHSSSDTYSVFFKKGLAKFQGSTIRLLKRKYSDWDGNPDTINQICRAHGIPRKMLVELKTIFGWTHDSEPFTDEEVATRDVEDLADDVLQAKKYALEQKVNKQAEQAVYKKAERLDLIEKLEINPLAEKISSFYGEYDPVEIMPASEIKGKDHSKAAFCSPFDLHYGKYAWSEQSGKAYDREAARENLISSAQAIARELILQGVSKVFIGVGSDFFHIDNYQGTTTKGTPQDLSGTPVQIMSEGYELMVHFIDIMRQVAPVELILVQGNHDYMLSATLMMYLAAYYRNTEHVTADISFKYRQYRKWGTTLIGMTHGDGGKMADLPYSMLKEADNEEVSFRVWFVGHLHHEKAVEMKGSKFFQLSSLSGSDRWHHRNQYETSDQGLDAFIIHKFKGVINRLFEPILN